MQTHGLGMETPNALPGMPSERMQRIRGRLHVSELHALTRHADLGDERSVFVSHSWHDGRQAKWEALKAWGEHERECEG